jgi:hypothetical protein
MHINTHNQNRFYTPSFDDDFHFILPSFLSRSMDTITHNQPNSAHFRYCLFVHDHVRWCYSCGRREPGSAAGARRERHVELSDGRALCGECASTAIFDSAEAAGIRCCILVLFCAFIAVLSNTHPHEKTGNYKYTAACIFPLF